MGRFSVELTITNHHDQIAAELGAIPLENVRSCKLMGVVDTGATRLVLPSSTVAQLGLPIVGRITVRFADGRTAEKAVTGEARVEIAGRSSEFRAVVEPGRTDALVGAIVLEELDFIADCVTQKLLPRDPHGMLAEIE
jgi:predicted aspartyl protease